MKKAGTLFKTHKGERLVWQRNHSHLLKDVYCNISESEFITYFNEVTSCPGTMWTPECFRNIDVKSDYVNIFNGIRQTKGNSQGPVEFKVHILGDSRVYGVGVEDSDTLSSCLQKLINDHGISANVINHGIRGNRLINVYQQISLIKTDPRDVFILFLTPYSNFWDKKRYADILAGISNKCQKEKKRLLIAKWPDIRLIKNPSFLERVLQRMVANEKKYVFIPEHPEKYKSPLQEKFSIIDTGEVANRPHSYKELFWDRHHPGPNGCRAVAEFLFKKIQCYLHPQAYDPLYESSSKHTYHEVDISQEIKNYEIICATEYAKQFESHLCSTGEYYAKYVPRFKAQENEKIGCIVMNCNPFSLGHLSLIEYALEQVKYLYVFIVEEDKSFFSFEQRIFLLLVHFKNNPRVKVVPSGKLILSSLTFPDYFDKEQKTEGKTDVLLDVNIFCNVIAKLFNISHRFVGTEPYCNITNQYNQILKEVLPRHGIEFFEVERFLIDGEPVSATKIRKCIKEKDMASLSRLVPEVTLNLIKELYT